MATFVDKFFKQGLIVPMYVGAKSLLVKQLGDDFAQAETIIAHNVSEYYFTCPTEYWKFPEDFPMVVPPFKNCFVELARPSKVWSKEIGESPEIRDRLPKTWGVLFSSMKLSEILGKDRESSYKKMGWRADLLRDLLSRFLQGVVQLENGDKAYKLQVATHDKSPIGPELEKSGTMDFGSIWFCTATAFSETPNGTVTEEPAFPDGSLIGPLGVWSYLVDKYGYVLGEPSFSLPANPEWVRSLDPNWDRAQHQMVHITKRLQQNTGATLYFPAFLAVSLMHCKNVVMGTVKPPPKLNKKHIKKGHRPLITYRTLEIEPMKKVLRHEGGADQTGISQALHICRGHFKDYRGSEKGLFGKYKGLWWWDQHLAGKAEHGTVVKDYVELAPGQDEDPLKEM